MAGSGFTLVELMVTLAVLTIILAIAVPGVGGFVSNQRVRSQADSMLASLALARNESITQNLRVTLCPSGNGTSCTGTWSQGWIVFRDGGTAGTVDVGDTVMRVFPGKKNVTVSMSGNFGSYLSFRPTGRSMGSGGATTGGTITVSGGSLTRTINVCSTGRIQAGGSC
ncbi:MAG: GspH/FimT family pseudopilin [Pseudomonadota bacterium]